VIATIVVRRLFRSAGADALALAVLMSFALGPLVQLFRRIRLGHLPAVLLSLFLAVVLIGGLGLFVGSQFADLRSSCPIMKATSRPRSTRSGVRPPATRRSTVLRRRCAT